MVVSIAGSYGGQCRCIRRWLNVELGVEMDRKKALEQTGSLLDMPESTAPNSDEWWFNHGYDAGYAKGQADMRERAAKEVEDLHDGLRIGWTELRPQTVEHAKILLTTKMIRALPIKDE